VEPRVYERDDFAVTLWTYYAPVTAGVVLPADYANALERLHAGMRKLDLATPHFTDRVVEAQRLVASHDLTPALADADRELLINTLESRARSIRDRGGAEQLLHGEPHPATSSTPRAVCCSLTLRRAAVGLSNSTWPMSPKRSAGYPGADQELLGECRILMLAMVAAWRWDQDDQFPGGRRMGSELLSQLRAALKP
jgi:hypothetical protein